MRIQTSFLIIFFLAIAVRLPLVNDPPYSDEILWPSLAHADNLMLDTQRVLFQPPISHFFFWFISKVVGSSIVAFRIGMLLFSIASLVLIYSIAKKIYNPQVGMLALLLAAFSFYMVESSTIIEIDGLLVFFSLLSIYFYLLFDKYREKKYLFGISIVLGLAFLSRANAVWIAIAILLYHLTKNRYSFTSVKTIGLCMFGIVAIYALFPLTAYLLSDNGEWSYWSYFLQTVKHVGDSAGDIQDKLPKGIALVVLALWATPFFIILPFLRKEKIAGEKLLFSFFGVTLFFLTFVVSKGGYDRYWTLAFPVLIILSAKALHDFHITYRELVLSVFSGVLFLITYEAVAYLFPAVPVIRSFSVYLERILALQWSFFFPLTIDHGPWFGMNFLLLVLGWIVALALLGSHFLAQKKIARLFLLLFLSSSLAFNTFLLLELVYPVTGHDYPGIVADALSFVRENEKAVPEEKWPIYSTDKAVIYELQPSFYGFHDDKLLPPQKQGGKKIAGYRIEDMDDLRNKTKTRGGTIIFINFTPYVAQEAIDLLSYCHKQRHYEQRGVVLGGVYTCDKQ